MLGIVLTNRRSPRLDKTLSDRVGALLLQGQLDATKGDPRGLIAPSATGALRAGLAEVGYDGAQMADLLRGALSAALAGAGQEGFTLCALVIALSLGAVLCLNMPGGDSQISRSRRQATA